MVEKRRLDSLVIARHQHNAQLKRKERELAVQANDAEMEDAARQKAQGLGRRGGRDEEDELDEEQESFMEEAQARGGEVPEVEEAEVVHGVKRRMTAAERKRAKKARKNGSGGGSGSGSGSGGGSSSDSAALAQEQEDALHQPVQTKQERKAAKVAAQKAHYIPHGISEHDVYVEGKYQAGENEKTEGSQHIASLDENILDLMSDDTKKMEENKRVMHWDRKKNKYVQRTVGELKRGNVKTRTESGQVVVQSKRQQAQEQGKYYAKWVKKNNRTIGENEYEGGATPGVVGADGDEPAGQSAVALHLAADYRGGKLNKRASGFGMGEVSYNVGGQVPNADIEEELKDEDVMRKEADEDQKKNDRNKGRKFMKGKGTGGKTDRKGKGKGGKFDSKGGKSKSKMIVRKGKSTKGGRHRR
jgi:hypothetical protein